MSESKAPPCKCKRLPFPHRSTWQCVQDEIERELRRERADEIAAEQDRRYGADRELR